MKDYDDLYRIFSSHIKIDKKKLRDFLKGMPEKLPEKYIQDLSPQWREHIKNYSDLPKDFEDIIRVINQFLRNIDITISKALIEK